jgi:hypothetical protein
MKRIRGAIDTACCVRGSANERLRNALNTTARDLAEKIS